MPLCSRLLAVGAFCLPVLSPCNITQNAPLLTVQLKTFSWMYFSGFPWAHVPSGFRKLQMMSHALPLLEYSHFPALFMLFYKRSSNKWLGGIFVRINACHSASAKTSGTFETVNMGFSRRMFSNETAQDCSLFVCYRSKCDLKITFCMAIFCFRRALMPLFFFLFSFFTKKVQK